METINIVKTKWNSIVGILMLSMITIPFYSEGEETEAAKNRFSVSGYVRDENGEELIGATVYVIELKNGSVTNLYGYYSVALLSGKYTIQYSYLGYATQTFEFNVTSDQRYDVILQPVSEEIESVQITAKSKKANIERIEMSTAELQMKAVKKMPSLLGEVDIIKSIQLLPGVTNAGEGSTGFFVRGGNVDQNLILLDGAPVYNPSHIGGFLSVFNADAIKNAEIYKGGIPAQYGGRLSSVLDLRMKEGSTTQFHGSGGIGLPVSSRLTLEGPIIKDKSSFIISGRRSYIDLFFPFAQEEAVKKSQVYFYDFNSKMNYKLNDNNRIFFSGYFGRDVAKFDTLFAMDYGNKTATIRWNHIYNPALFSNLTLIYSNFSYGLGQPTGPFAFDWSAHVIDYGINNDYTWFLTPENKIRFGFQTKIHHFKPGKGEPIGESLFNQPPLDNNFGLETGIYVNNEQELTKRLSLSYGIRFSHYTCIGNDTIYNFEEKDFEIIRTDSTIYKKGEFYSPYHGWEPRLGIRFKINQNTSLKASYNRMYQYIQMARNTVSATPLDLWFGTNPNIKPQRADQVAIGIFQNFLNDQLEGSIEVYYKKNNNSIDFKDHAQLQLNKYFDGELRFGTGYSYGAEFFLKKETGKFTGWIAYTLSKTMWDIHLIHKPDYYQNGHTDMEYPASYDKPHDLSITLSYDMKKWMNISGSWVYASAMPTTVPTSKYSYRGEWVPVYSERNNVRIPGNEYHRLDLSVTFDFKHPGNDNFYHGLNISLYNVYFRHNTYSVLFRQDEDNPEFTKASKLYLFKMIPSVTYNFKF
ncbi:TonB-dependent receptor domain-containing protein [Bacteroidota bacterium]